MRCYQEIGLKPEAESWLRENVWMIPNQICPHCQKVISERMDSKVYEKVDSFYNDGPHLQEYTLKDGSKVKEVVQIEPWSSGPMSFFCLQKEDGTRMFEWTGDDVCGREEGLVAPGPLPAGENEGDKVGERETV